MQPKRILLKISGETLKGKSEGNFDTNFMQTLAKEIKKLSDKGLEIVIVTGGGNIFRGIEAQGGINVATGHYMGMVATLMNGMALGDILEKEGINTKIMSAIEAPRVAPTFHRKKAMTYLKDGNVVIATAGTGNPYCTNDLAAVIRALELHCDIMIKATKVDGIYDKDPMKYKDAKKFEKLSLKKAYEQKLNIMDHSAIATAMDNKLPIFVCKIEDIGQLPELKNGTLVSAE